MSGLFESLAIALIASLPGILALYLQNKRDKVEAETKHAEKESEEADAAVQIQTAALAMMETYKKEFEIMKGKINNLEGRVKELETTLEKELEDKNKIISGAWKLYNQVSQMDKTPVYTPPRKN